MILKYKNYTGEVKYDADAKIFHGEVIGIRDVITFVSKTEDGLKAALQDSVEDYIELCKEKGKLPQKSYSGDVRLRIEPKTHAKLALEAAYKGLSLNSFISTILNNEINKR